MIKQRLKMIVGIILVPVVMFAQQPLTSVNNQIIPQQPDVASLFNFAEVPVSHFNGTADINIPLYEIKSGDLSYPITLNYHTSGIKVGEESGIVGLGWSISTTACISETNPPINVAYTLPTGIAPEEYAYPPSQVLSHTSHLMNVPMTGEVFRDTAGNCHTYRAFPNYVPGSEPDMFILSANGISGKFFVLPGDALNKWREVGMDNIQLYGTEPNYCENCGGPFTAILPNGTKYIFNDIGVTITPPANVSTPYMVGVSTTYCHTYYLNQIISPTGKTIRFKYLNPNSVPTTLSQQGLSQTWAQDNCVNFDAAFQSSTILTPSSTIQNLYIDTIFFDNGYCKYLYSGREDMDGYKLNEIDIHNESSLIRKIVFQYGYYMGTKVNYGDYVTDAQFSASFINGPQESYRQERLKLQSVQINDDSPYVFTYDNTPLPYKTSFAQDLWGYFNGNMTKSLLPNYNYLGYFDAQVPAQLLVNAPISTFGYRAASFPYTQAGILTQVKYPTGGRTSFEYEPNSFYINTGQNVSITDTIVSAEDLGDGQKSVIFTVPNVGVVGTGAYAGQLVNPANITVQLICPGGTGGCSNTGYSGNCFGYNGGNNIQNGLYAIVQRQDPNTGQWLMPDQTLVFDFSNPAIDQNVGGPCGAPNIAEQLPPGTYKITANYPDGVGGGEHGGPSAFILVQYKVEKAISQPNKGGGLRIKEITDYSSSDNTASQKTFTYSAGKMMTKPIFYRYMQSGTYEAGISTCAPDPSLEWTPVNSDIGGSEVPGTLQGDRTFVILYNNPVLPYSYSANGSPVGYDTVYEQKTDPVGTTSGRTIYTYNAEPDEYNFYGTILPGIPSTPYLDNGYLKTRIDQLFTGGGNYKTIHSISYNYAIPNQQVFWVYKYEYFPKWCYPYEVSDGNGGSTYIPSLPQYSDDPNSQYLHFYPVKTGHVNIINKTEQTLTALGNMMATVTNYSYNAFNQPDTVTTTESNGKTYATINYYPGDYTSNDFTQQMRNKNMIDYPIEKIEQINSATTSALYFKYQSHDNMITPQQSYLVKATSPFDITPSIPNNTIDFHYQPEMNYTYDAYGNIVTQQKASDVNIVYLWGYDHSYPVAKIVGSDYVTAGSIVSQSTIDAAVSNDAEMRSVLNTLRTNLPNAQVWTYTYAPLIGMTSETDPKGNTTYYEYDSFGRLKDAKDKDGNVIKRYDYHYQDQ